MKLLHFFVGDVFAVRFLSVFTNSTINEHHAIEFDWSKTGEENFMDISKIGLKILWKPHDKTSFIVLIHEFSRISVLLNRWKNFKFRDSTGSNTSCSFVLGGKQFIVGGVYKQGRYNYFEPKFSIQQESDCMIDRKR